MTTDEWIQKAKSIHGDKYDYSQTVYVNQRTNVKIICPTHGVFEQKADSHIRGCGCRFCGFESDKRTGVHNWSDEQRKKIADTCLQKYGAKRYLDSDEGKEKITEIKSSQEFRDKMHNIISSDTVQNKTKTTCLSKYGVTSAMKLSVTVDKCNESKRQNGTWGTSESEERMYGLLCDAFDKENVVRQHKDSRYPFRCDFYIKSLDLFIELNATWSHGGHWFDSNSINDLSVLAEWQLKSVFSAYYKDAIDVWTVRDVRKLKTARENHLNYLVFWQNNLSDFKAWLESDSLVLNNI